MFSKHALCIFTKLLQLLFQLKALGTHANHLLVAQTPFVKNAMAQVPAHVYPNTSVTPTPDVVLNALPIQTVTDLRHVLTTNALILVPAAAV